MRLPAKILYAYKAIIELALSYNSHVPLTIERIARAQNIPKQFLVHLLIRLKNAGLVRSVRGTEGGYLLNRAPCEISLANVFSVMDDNFIVRQAGANTQDESNKILMKICDDAGKRMINALEEQTFDSLILRFRTQNLNYCI